VGLTASGSTKLDNANILNILSGNITINGRLATSAGTTTISGGTIKIDPQVTSVLPATNHTFEVQSGGTLNMSGGTVTIVDPISTTGTGLDLKFSGTISCTGGTIYLGDGISTSAGSADGFEVYLSSGKYLNNFVINNPSGTNRHVALTDHTTKKDFQLNGNMTITAGELRAYGPDATSANLIVNGNWTNNASFKPGSSTKITFSGTSAQTYKGQATDTIPLLTLNNSAGLTLDSSVVIGTTLTLTNGTLSTGAKTLTLGPNAVMTEAAGSTVLGTTTTTRTISSGSNNTLGGIGVEINPAGSAPGSTVVTRVTGTAQTGNGNQGIKRYFTFSPTTNTGLNAVVVFHYDESELNGIAESNLRAFQSTDAGSTWTYLAGVDSASANKFTLSNIDALNRLTLGSANAPLSTPQTLNLTAGIEGLRTGATQIQDTVTVYLCGAASPYSRVDSARIALNSSAQGQGTFLGAANGSYYIAVTHRNAVETWSASPQTFAGTSNYDFTTSQNQAYGDNMVFVGSVWCIYSGDVNQDGFIDFSDLGLIDNDSYNYVTGYVITDLNGDEFIDFSDLGMCDNNAYNYIGCVKPGGAATTSHRVLKIRHLK
jgi:hypothetical protein